MENEAEGQPSLHCVTEQLAVQVCDQCVAVLHHGELLVDPDGGALPPQSHLPGSVLRYQLHHSVRLARMG